MKAGDCGAPGSKARPPGSARATPLGAFVEYVKDAGP